MLADRYRAALARCRLIALSDDTLDKLTQGANFLDVPADTTVMRFGSTGPFVAIVVDGLLRTYLSSETGRRLTVRYMRPGDIVGATGVFTRPLADLAVQTITDSRCRTMFWRRDESVVLARALM